MKAQSILLQSAEGKGVDNLEADSLLVMSQGTALATDLSDGISELEDLNDEIDGVLLIENYEEGHEQNKDGLASVG